jgi:hypothetical protein
MVFKPSTQLGDSDGGYILGDLTPTTRTYIGSTIWLNDPSAGSRDCSAATYSDKFAGNFLEAVACDE